MESVKYILLIVLFVLFIILSFGAFALTIFRHLIITNKLNSNELENMKDALGLKKKDIRHREGIFICTDVADIILFDIPNYPSDAYYTKLKELGITAPNITPPRRVSVTFEVEDYYTTIKRD